MVEMEINFGSNNLIYETDNKKMDKTYDFQKFLKSFKSFPKFLTKIYHYMMHLNNK